MEKRKKKEHDFNLTAFRVVQEATGQIEPEPEKPKRTIADPKTLRHKGGNPWAEKLAPERRKEIAERAARTRWEKQ